jgi:hypothetical protein
MITKKAIGTVGRMWADTVDAQFTDSLALMMQYSQMVLCEPGEFIYYNHATVSWHESGRQQLLEQAMGDWLFMTDTDHAFSPDMLVRLLRFKDKYKCRVISAMYFSKNEPHVPVVNQWLKPDDPKDHSFKNMLEFPADEVIDCGPCGAGALLVDLDVFKDIQVKLGQAPFGTIPGISEDYSFYTRCKVLGIKTYLCPLVESHHLTQRGRLSLR